MLAMEIWNEAGDMAADALRRPSWASPTGAPQPRISRLAGVRRVCGHALIGLGRVIAAEHRPSTTPRIG
jgi:hypothetical protein